MSLAFLIEEGPAAWLALTGSGKASREGLAGTDQHRLNFEGFLSHPLYELLPVLRGLAASDF